MLLWQFGLWLSICPSHAGFTLKSHEADWARKPWRPSSFTPEPLHWREHTSTSGESRIMDWPVRRNACLVWTARRLRTQELTLRGASPCGVNPAWWSNSECWLKAAQWEWAIGAVERLSFLFFFFKARGSRPHPAFFSKTSSFSNSSGSLSAWSTCIIIAILSMLPTGQTESLL